MRHIRNMKTRTRMLAGYLLILSVTAAVAILAVVNLRSIDNRYTYALSYPFERYSIIKELRIYIMNARRTMNRMAMYIHDPVAPVAGIRAQEEYVYYLRSRIDYLLAALRTNIIADPGISELQREQMYGDLTVFVRHVIRDLDYYIAGMTAASLAFDAVEVLRLTREGVTIAYNAAEHERFLVDTTFLFMHGISEDLAVQTNRTIALLAILASAGVLIGWTVALFISGKVTKPIEKAVSVLGDVRIGKLDAEIGPAYFTKDEPGNLIRDVFSLIETVKAINAEVKGIVAAAADRGDMNYIIDADKYSGEWREIMLGLNRITKAVDTPILEIRYVMEELSYGNFNKKIVGDYKGDFLRIKETINNTVDAFSRFVTNEVRQERDAYEFIQTIIDTAPIIISQWDGNYNLIGANMQAVYQHNVRSREQYIERFHDLSPECQPCGTPSREKARAYLTEAYEKGYAKFEWLHQTLNGEPIPSMVTLVRSEHKNKEMVLGYVADLRDIKETEEYIKTILDNSPLLIEFWDTDGNLLDGNQKILDILNVSNKAEFVDKFYAFSTEHQPGGQSPADKNIEMINHAVEKGSARSEWTFLLPDGEELPTESTWVHIIHQGKPLVIVYSQDLRPVKEAMRREQESIDRWNKINEASPIPMLFWDVNENFMGSNEAGYRLIDFPNKDDFRDNWIAIGPKFQPDGTDTQDKIGKAFAVAMAEGHCRFELQYATVNGEDLPLDVTLVKIKLHDEYIVASYLIDLRPIRKADEKMREAEKMNEMILGSAPVSINVVDETITHVLCNRQTLKMFGFSDEESYINNLRLLNPERQPCGSPSIEKLTGYLKTVMEKGFVRFEWLHQLLNGDMMPTEITMVRFEKNGKPMIVTYTVDLRPIKASMQRERDLEKKLLEKELNERLEIIEEGNRAKSAFLARMSHEIRTPISVIMGVSEIELQSPDILPRTEEAFAKIYSSSNLLLALVNDILDLSKIESGKMILMPDKYEVTGMIADIAHLQLVYTNNKNIAFRLNVDEKLPSYLVGDVVRIVQIVNNLLSNAFKYTESGFVDLTLAGRKDDPADDCIIMIITVNDTGFGMTADQVKRLGTEYLRFHENGNRFIGGVGLGMSIVYNLVQMMGARIEIESEAGVGTKVTVSIPQKIASSEVLGIETAEALQRFDNDINVAKRFSIIPEPMPYGRVLVVDDMEDNLYVAKGLLAFYALAVETCNSGPGAINKIKAGNVYDLVFLDYMMPGMNGTEVLQEMRALGYTKPIVVLTANAMIGQAEAFINSGFDGFISKPIQVNHLNAILTKHIRDKQPPEVIEAAKTSGDAFTADIYSYQNSDELTNKLRADFVKKYSGMCSDIHSAIIAGDIETAHRLAHTLKGIAGLIHERPLMKAAGHVEHLLRDGKMPADQCLSDLENEFKRVIEAIGPEYALPENDGVRLSPEESIALLDKAMPLLTSQNFACIKMLDELRKIPGAAVLCSKIENFDFEDAVEILPKLRLSLGGGGYGERNEQRVNN